MLLTTSYAKESGLYILWLGVTQFLASTLFVTELFLEQRGQIAVLLTARVAHRNGCYGRIHVRFSFVFASRVSLELGVALLSLR